MMGLDFRVGRSNGYCVLGIEGSWDRIYIYMCVRTCMWSGHDDADCALQEGDGGKKLCGVEMMVGCGRRNGDDEDEGCRERKAYCSDCEPVDNREDARSVSRCG